MERASATEQQATEDEADCLGVYTEFRSRGYPHFVYMPKDTVCMRFCCDVCGTQSGQRDDFFFERRLKESNLRSEMALGNICFLYDPTYMARLFVDPITQEIYYWAKGSNGKKTRVTVLHCT
jgi:hypothetical protein